MLLETQVVGRNTLNQVVVMSSDPKGTVQMEWGPKDDPNGADVQIIPKEIAQHPQFAKLVSRGVIEIIEAPEDYQAAMEKQAAAFRGRLNTAAKAVESLDPEANNDLLSLPCVGPGERGGECGTPVPVREQTKNEKAPLCDRHSDLSPQYVSHQAQEGTSIVTKWSRVTVTAPERQQA